MKTRRTFFTTLLIIATSSLMAQVQINKPIQLTGGTGERVITNLETPVNGTDAVNKDYVDAAVAASGGSSITEVSAESSSPMDFGAAMRYCQTSTEGGNSDWRLPSYLELTSAVSSGNVTVPNPTSANNVQFLDNLSIGNSSIMVRYIRLSDGVMAGQYYYSPTSAYVRCVR